MERSRLFISYSQKDRNWLERLTEQLSVLQRRGLVDVWSDELIAVGEAWEPAIESALTGAKIAVLLVSPSFLASEFIWTREIPRIAAHAAQGMEALPLIIRPCAWKLESFLAALQARPGDGRALSLGDESQIDLDLSSFVTEVAEKLGYTRFKSVPPQDAPHQGREQVLEEHFNAVGEWVGQYGPGLAIQLRVVEQSQTSFSGTLTYDDGTVTNVDGSIFYNSSWNDVHWTAIEGASDPDHIAITFKEVGYIQKGRSEVDLRGEYRAYASPTSMRGAWIGSGGIVGGFWLRRGGH
jgi:TIR domain